MPTAPIPLATYLASLTMNFYDLADVRQTGDAVIQVAGGNGSVSIPVAQGVQGFSVYAGATLPTASSPAGAVPMDKYILTAADGAGLPGDMYRKAGDNTWALIGSIRGAAGHPMLVGTTVPTAAVPAGAVAGDQYLFLGTSGGTPGDVYVKAASGTWSVQGNQRGPAGPSGAAQMQDRGNWAATTAYVSGDVVTNGGFRWLVKTAHTSGTTFSGNTNWIPLSPPETSTVVPTPLVSPWTNFGGSYATAAYSIVGTRVHLRGVVTTAPSLTGPFAIFYLPAGYRPAAQEVFACSTGGSSAIRVDIQSTDGSVQIGPGASLMANSIVSLSGISFSTVA